MVDSIDDIRGLGERKAEALRKSGYREPRDLRKATRAELAKVEGIGGALATRIKRQAGTRAEGELVANVGHQVSAPDDWRITPREAAYLADRSDLEAATLIGESATDVGDRLDWELDPDLLGFRRVCGVVRRRNPETGELEPVPHATVHVEDTDCSFLGYFPDEPPWGWLLPFDCRREVIATVRTNACGEFCVYVPRWEVDRLIRFRRERYCLPELVKPTIEDLLRDPRILPEPPWPGPRPDPGPLRFDKPQTFDRVREVLGGELATTLVGETQPTFGARKHAGGALLERPAFLERVPAPLPNALEEVAEAEAVLEQEHLLKVARSPLDREAFVGPFLPCRDVYIPEFVTVTDVPDVTFRVTQDVDGDGDEEPIYEEGFFDVRWNEDPIPEVTLLADESARSVPTCDGPDIAEGECGELRLLTAGLMSLAAPYHDVDTGYAHRPNRPKVDDGSGGVTRPDTKTPYTGVIQFHGCVRVEDASYYRVKYAFEGHDAVPFTDLSWYVPRLDPTADHLHMSPDAEGWYEIPPEEELVFPYWVLNWPTGRFPNGRYEITLEVADDAKVPLTNGESEPVAVVVDNARPRIDYSVEWSTDGAIWHRLPEPCPVIHRDPGETVEFRATYTASAGHFRDVQVSATGCDDDPVATGDPADYGHWYTDPDADNSYSATARFTVPDALPDGTYSIHFHAHGRAFNPSGGRGGPADDWYYDQAYVHRHPSRHISIVTD